MPRLRSARLSSPSWGSPSCRRMTPRPRREGRFVWRAPSAILKAGWRAKIASVPESTTHRITLTSDTDLLPLSGRNDENLRLLESHLDLRIVARGAEITLKGPTQQVARGARVLEELQAR